MNDKVHSNGWRDSNASSSVAGGKVEQPTALGTNQKSSATATEKAPKLHHDGSFRKYMEGKINKLQIQFKKQSSTLVSGEVDGSLCQLFQGVSIFVNGYTEPSHSELKNIMAQYGGEFHNYYSRSSVTHIVCSNLPDAKVKQFEKEKSPTPVVRPEWVVECVKAKRVLPIADFLLWQLRPGGAGQRMLSMFKVGANTGGIRKERQWIDHAEMTTNAFADAAVSKGGMTRMQCEPKSGKEAADRYDALRLEAARRVAEKMRAECESLKGRPKSSSDDPEFVNSFYRASRLHFIGTWKSRLERMMASDILHDAPEPTKELERIVIHIDMDCFFASVAEASHPEFSGLPVAVCHSNHKGSGEISSANYEARKYGLHASMFMVNAKELCPDLIVVPYEFEKYEIVSEKMYRILFKHSSLVQPVSCDEAYLDVTGLGDPERIASSIRETIEKETKCCASAGIGPNMLLARIATARAKPNGQCRMTRECALQDLASLDVEELPGVGWRMGQKLRAEGICKIKDVQASSEKRIQKILGNKTGSLVFNFAYGCDDRSVCPPAGRKSIGAEVNWGVRFQSKADTNKFLFSISKQISERMKASNVNGKSLTIKIKRKRSGWTEPVKFLGMGSCDSLSRTVTLQDGVRDTEEIYSESKLLLDSFQLHFSEIRGMGISVSKLEEASKKSPTYKRYQPRIDLMKRKNKPEKEMKTIAVVSEAKNGKMPKAKPKPGALSGFVAKRHAGSSQTNKITHSKDSVHFLDAKSIDKSVLEELPIEIRREIEVAYGLNQTIHIKENAKNTRDKSNSVPSASVPQRSVAVGKPISRMPQVFDEPLRLSQIDQSVFQELPELLQKDILKSVDLSKKSTRKRTASVFHRPNVKAQKGMHDDEAVYSSTFERLASSLQNNILQSVAYHLHSNKVSEGISVLETDLAGADGQLEYLLSTDAVDKTSDLETLIDILKNEFKCTNASGIPLESKWFFCRGINRLGCTYNSFKGFASTLVQVMQQELLAKTCAHFCLD